VKILVEHKNGHKEIITLVPPVEIFDRPELKQHHFHCGDGMDHYFCAETGHYDGWGMAMHGSMEEAKENIDRILGGQETPDT
jgi:hypothetical protein